jgi:hypothetical protein
VHGASITPHPLPQSPLYLQYKDLPFAKIKFLHTIFLFVTNLIAASPCTELIVLGWTMDINISVFDIHLLYYLY